MLTHIPPDAVYVEAFDTVGFDRWHEALELGLTAHLLLSFSPASRSDRDVLRELRRQLLAKLDGKSRAWYLKLPPAVIRALVRASHDEPRAGLELSKLIRSKTEDALYRLVEKANDKAKNLRSLPLFDRARIWATQALEPTASERELRRMATDLFSWDRTRLRDGGAEIAGALDSLSVPWRPTSVYLRAVVRLRDTLIGPDVDSNGEPFKEWAQVENVLCHRLFGWPLLTTPAGATTLPVGVQVTPPRQRFGTTVDTFLIGVDPSLHTDEWDGRLRQCVRVAKQLWRAKNGRSGSLRQDVDNAFITFDFSLASEISNRVAGPLGKSVDLRDGSAEAYFVQLVLARLLGDVAFPDAAVSGRLGPQLRDSETLAYHLNYQVLGVEAAEAKLTLAAETQLFERAVLPTAVVSLTPRVDAKELWHYERDFPPPDNIQTVTDLAGPRGWRQYSYVRVPEALAVHTSRKYKSKHAPTLSTTPTHEVGFVLEALASGSGGSVLRLEASVLKMLLQR